MLSCYFIKIKSICNCISATMRTPFMLKTKTLQKSRFESMNKLPWLVWFSGLSTGL